MNLGAAAAVTAARGRGTGAEVVYLSSFLFAKLLTNCCFCYLVIVLLITNNNNIVSTAALSASEDKNAQTSLCGAALEARGGQQQQQQQHQTTTTTSGGPDQFRKNVGCVGKSFLAPIGKGWSRHLVTSLTTLL